MARRKSLAAQLLQVYQERQKAKAAAAKRAEAERARQAREAERIAAARAREEARREREAAQAWSHTQKEKQARQSADARRAEQIVRDLEKRNAARAKELEQKRRAEVRKKAAAERLAKQETVEAMRREALKRTAEVEERLRVLSVLRSRPGGMHQLRLKAEQAFGEGDLEGFAVSVEEALGSVGYPQGVGGTRRVAFAPESRELVVEVELPGQAVVPSVAQYRFKASTPPAVVPQPRKEAETKALYRDLVARLALRAIDEAFAVTPPALVDQIAFNGKVRAKDRATGKTIEPCLVSVRVSREGFADLVLDEPELDPVASLHHLNAIVSQHPYDLEPVRPVVSFDLSRYKIAPERDVVAGLDSRPDLVAMDPTDFEHLIRRLFEKIGLKSWVTQASRDDGIDAVAVNEEPLIGGLCIIQAKRTKNVVSAETVRAVAGLVVDKGASKGIVVTTAWFGKASWDFAPRNRVELIDGRHPKALHQ
ncbi:restriction endonuclease [Streptomyces hydrogenans]|uniref:restriction endonuclease n=1 Tax=Streptomyces hydrogenans TaxID=1873719 RepID=UPI003643B0CA